MWLIIPLGNPGDAYTATRHNLGRLIFTRWVKVHAVSNFKVINKLRYGVMYFLSNNISILIPKTYMNLSGLACAEVVSLGYDAKNIIVLCDDKDLPLGLGRLRLLGSAGGHNGLKSIFEKLQRQDVPRLRLGIGPFSGSLADFVLDKWTETEWPYIKNLDYAFDSFMELLENTQDLHQILSTVNNKEFWLAK